MLYAKRMLVFCQYLVHPFFLLGNNIVSYKRDVACAECLESKQKVVRL